MPRCSARWWSSWDCLKTAMSLAVILRADAAIGTGHLMRVRTVLACLSGVKCHLLADSLDQNLLPLCAGFAGITRCPLEDLPDAVDALAPAADGLAVCHGARFDYFVFYATAVRTTHTFLLPQI